MPHRPEGRRVVPAPSITDQKAFDQQREQGECNGHGDACDQRGTDVAKSHGVERDQQ